MAANGHDCPASESGHTACHPCLIGRASKQHGVDFPDSKRHSPVSFEGQFVLRVSVVMETATGRRLAAAVRSNSNVSGGGGNSNINLSASSGSHNPGAPVSVVIGGSTTATSGVGSGSLSSSSAATGPRLRRQRSYEWRERQYSTSEDENVVTGPTTTGLIHVGNTRTSNASLQSTGGGGSAKQRASPTPAVYAAGIASLLAGYSSEYPTFNLYRSE